MSSPLRIPASPTTIITNRCWSYCFHDFAPVHEYDNRGTRDTTNVPDTKRLAVVGGVGEQGPEDTRALLDLNWMDAFWSFESILGFEFSSLYVCGYGRVCALSRNKRWTAWGGTDRTTTGWDYKIWPTQTHYSPHFQCLFSSLQTVQIAQFVSCIIQRLLQIVQVSNKFRACTGKEG